MKGEKAYRLGKTCVTWLAFFGLGVSMSLTGPSLPDMCVRLGVSIDQISLAPTVSMFTWMAASPICGLLIDRFQSKTDPLMSIGLILTAVFTTVKMFCSTLWSYVIATMFESVGYTISEVAGNTMTLVLWGKDNNAPMQGIHGAWATGAVLAPLIIRPFLGPDTDSNQNLNMTGLVDPNSTDHRNMSFIPLAARLSLYGDEASIEIAAIIAGVILIAPSIILVVTYLKGEPKGINVGYKKADSFKKVITGNSDGRMFRVVMLIGVALFYFGNSGREMTVFNFLFSYAVEGDLKFSKQEAALLDSAAKFSFMAGRMLSTIVALFIRIQVIMITLVFLTLGSVALLATVGTQSRVYLWTFVCISNICASPLWPGYLAWADKYIVASGIVIAVMDLGAGTSGAVSNWLTGYLFSAFSPGSVFYVSLANTVLLTTVMVIMQIIAHRHGQRFSSRVADMKDPQEEEQTEAL